MRKLKMMWLSALLLATTVSMSVAVAQQQRRQSGARDAQRQPPRDTETLIRNATLLTVSHGTLQNSDILVRRGKIVAIGQNLKARDDATRH